MIPEGPDVPAIALTLRTKRTGAIGTLTSHASVHASVSASPQFSCSSEGTVVLIHGFPPPGLASNHRGWGIHTHSIFTRRPQGEPAAFSICRSPYRDRLRAVFLLAGAGQTKLSVSRQRFRERFLTERIGLSALGGVERAEHPARNQPPSVGGSVRRPQVPPRRGRFSLESMADEAAAGL
jgi:hypothetical protein